MLQKLKQIFTPTMSLDRVRDKIDFAEGGERLTLFVDDDAPRLVIGITAAQKQIAELPSEPTEDDLKSAATAFARAMFGPEQAQKIVSFYHENYIAVLSICGKYFTERLSKKIAEKQMHKGK